MKILIYTNLFPTISDLNNGIFIYQRIAELKKSNIDVVVIRGNRIVRSDCLFCSLKNYNTKDLGFKENIDVNVINYLKLPKTSFFIHLLGPIESIIKNSDFNCLHGHGIFDSWPIYRIAKKLKIPYIVTAHGSDIHTVPFRNKLIKKLSLEVMENASNVIFVSHSLLNVARKLGYKSQNYTIIPNGVNESIFKYHLPLNKRKYVGFVGRLLSVKGADRLPELFYQISQKRTDISFFIVGSGPLKKIIVAKLKHYNLLERVHLFDYLPPEKLSEYLNKTRVLVVPSRKEGYPNIVVEAKKCGVSIVGSDIESLREAIGENNGFLVKENDNYYSAMAEAIIRFWENPLPVKDILSSVSTHNWSNIIRKEISVYEKI